MPDPAPPSVLDPCALAMQVLNIAILVLDDATCVQGWNAGAERLLGITGAAAIGRRFADLPIRWDWEELGAHVPGCRAERRVTLDGMSCLQPDGRRILLAVEIVPVDTGPYRSIWRVEPAIAHDASPDPGRVARQMQAIGGLASGIAHEINTPMQFIGDNMRFIAEAVSGLAAGLARITAIAERADPADVAEAVRANDLPYLLEEAPKALAQTQEGIQRVVQIVKAMKSFAHPGADHPVPTDINQLIESTLTVSRNVWKYVADVALTLASDLPLVPVVPGGFQQVILNLVTNAAHAIEDAHGVAGGNDTGRIPAAKGTITLRTAVADELAVVEVSDTGCGIPEAIRARIFDPFFTTKAAGRGTGQGLAIVQAEIVDRLHGRIEVESRPGQGSTFRVLLPLAPASASDGGQA